MDDVKAPYELRWLSRYEPSPNYSEEKHIVQLVRRLQFRVRDTNPLMCWADDENNWSAWQDVPEAKE